MMTVGTKIGVDFGPTAPTNYFNQVNASQGNISAGNVIDTSNTAVDGVGFTWTTPGGAFLNNDSTGPGPAVFNDSNLTDWYGISNKTLNPTGAMTLTFTGLNDAGTYDLIIGARFTNHDADTKWVVDGQSYTTDSTIDAKAFASFTGLHTDGAGNLVIKATGAGTRTDISTVSALHLTATAIPEPSSICLLAAGVIVLIWAKKRGVTVSGK